MFAHSRVSSSELFPVSSLFSSPFSSMLLRLAVPWMSLTLLGFNGEESSSPSIPGFDFKDDDDPPPSSTSHGPSSGYVYQNFHGPLSGDVREVQYSVPDSNSDDPTATETIRELVAKPEYYFSYGVEDPETGNVQSRKEIRDGSNVRGEYSVLEADGYLRKVEYHADAKNGFRANVNFIPPAGGSKETNSEEDKYTNFKTAFPKPNFDDSVTKIPKFSFPKPSGNYEYDDSKTPKYPFPKAVPGSPDDNDSKTPNYPFPKPVHDPSEEDDVKKYPSFPKPVGDSAEDDSDEPKNPKYSFPKPPTESFEDDGPKTLKYPFPKPPAESSEDDEPKTPKHSFPKPPAESSENEEPGTPPTYSFPKPSPDGSISAEYDDNKPPKFSLSKPVREFAEYDQEAPKIPKFPPYSMRNENGRDKPKIPKFSFAKTYGSADYDDPKIHKFSFPKTKDHSPELKFPKFPKTKGHSTDYDDNPRLPKFTFPKMNGISADYDDPKLPKFTFPDPDGNSAEFDDSKPRKYPFSTSSLSFKPNGESFEEINNHDMPSPGDALDLIKNTKLDPYKDGDAVTENPETDPDYKYHRNTPSPLPPHRESYENQDESEETPGKNGPYERPSESEEESVRSPKFASTEGGFVPSPPYFHHPRQFGKPRKQTNHYRRPNRGRGTSHLEAHEYVPESIMLAASSERKKQKVLFRNPPDEDVQLEASFNSLKKVPVKNSTFLVVKMEK